MLRPGYSCWTRSVPSTQLMAWLLASQGYPQTWNCPYKIINKGSNYIQLRQGLTNPQARLHWTARNPVRATAFPNPGWLMCNLKIAKFINIFSHIFVSIWNERNFHFAKRNVNSVARFSKMLLDSVYALTVLRNFKKCENLFYVFSNEYNARKLIRFGESSILNWHRYPDSKDSRIDIDPTLSCRIDVLPISTRGSSLSGNPRYPMWYETGVHVTPSIYGGLGTTHFLHIKLHVVWQR